MASRSRTAVYARRRKRRMAAQEHDLTDAQWAALVEAWGGCAYCGSAETTGLQKDCMLPISRGGRYTVGNVVPACRSCNASKCNTELTSWMRRKKLDERAFLTRQWQIAHTLAVANEH
ncbi:MAG: HNH endonuclease [Actinobacteria bacterium]|nr:HNH endonuclease [Actinomycetota bacterium]